MARIEVSDRHFDLECGVPWSESKFFGVMNFEEGILVDGAITSIGTVLHNCNLKNPL